MVWRFSFEFGCIECPPHLFALHRAKVLMMRMHRPRHEARSASSLRGERGSARLGGQPRYRRPNSRSRASPVSISIVGLPCGHD